MIFKQNKTCSDSILYELLQFIRFSNMYEHVQTCLDLFRFNMIWIVTLLKHVWTCSNMSKLVQVQYDMNCCDSYDSQTCLTGQVQTRLNLFRFTMIWIATIHTLLKHVWTCSNMSKFVQIQYDMNCCDSYDSQTCQKKFKHS